MTIMEELEEEAKIPHLKLITGGKSPPIGNWLSKLPEDTVFLCKEKAGGQKRWVANQFRILFKTPRTALLLNNTNQPDIRIFVLMEDFSQDNELIEVQIRGPELDGDSDTD